jgi:hypothetical protein
MCRLVVIGLDVGRGNQAFLLTARVSAVCHQKKQTMWRLSWRRLGFNRVKQQEPPSVAESAEILMVYRKIFNGEDI